jgi:transcriptional regulator with XRE-family HTH domain
MPERREPLPDRLLRLRVERRLSQRALARRLERTHAIVSRWESGEREPSLLDLRQVARVLKVDLDEMLTNVRVAEQGRVRSSRAHSAASRLSPSLALRGARLVRRQSPLAVCAATGIPAFRLHQVESGADPSLHEVLALCGHYGIRPSDLLNRCA